MNDVSIDTFGVLLAYFFLGGFRDFFLFWLNLKKEKDAIKIDPMANSSNPLFIFCCILLNDSIIIMQWKIIKVSDL